MGVECVISRYNETIDWIKYLPYESINAITVYNKGLNDNYFRSECPDVCHDKIQYHRLPNIGRMDHTIVYHILENWDTLEEITVFLPASILMNEKKGLYLSLISKNIANIHGYKGFYSPRFQKVWRSFNYSINDYQSEGQCNRNNNPFIKSEYPDFKAWKRTLVDDRPIRYVAFRGMFIVAKENIKYIDKSVYTRILNSVSVGDNIENGHFAERIWAHLFRQLPTDQIVETEETELQLTSVIL
jgi:hypothetical protein